MANRNDPGEHKFRVEKTLNYMLKHLGDDLSLAKLAAVANYSPFHFQRIFKDVTGQSPKKYVNALRLEIAAHYLIIHEKKPIAEIATDCGFSSPAVFARSFKHHFGIAAENMRMLPHDKRFTLRNQQRHLKKLLSNSKNDLPNPVDSLQVNITVLDTIEGYCVNTSFDNIAGIEAALNEIRASSHAHGLFEKDSRMMGIIYPHHNIYKAFISSNVLKKSVGNIHKTEIPGGKFASFKTTGNIHYMFNDIEFFHKHWLPKSGYKIAQVYGFERFINDPTKTPYQKAGRELFIPIEPV